ncbi:MAG: anti-sigma factor family protein [Myxococcaceae bacterium]
MDCAVSEERMLPYELGTLEPRERSEVEEHLPSCPTCVRALVTMKQALRPGDEAARPSEEARTRLRREVARALSRTRRRQWGLAAAMAAALLLFAASRFHSPTAERAAPLSGVDSAVPEQTIDHVL